jgi:hypothetical protein
MRLTLKELRHSSGPVFSENSFSSFLFSFAVSFFFSFDFFRPAFSCPYSLPSYFFFFISIFYFCLASTLSLSSYSGLQHAFPKLYVERPGLGVTDELVSFCEGAMWKLQFTAKRWYPSAKLCGVTFVKAVMVRQE